MPLDRHSGPNAAAKSSGLLAADEPPAYRIERPQGRSPLFITCDHASPRIPRALGSLGVSDSELRRHIAWDIGAAAVALRLAQMLDACAIQQNYSRLVIDCNRPPLTPDSIAVISENTAIPGNVDLADEAAAVREHEIFAPYHARIVQELDARAARRQPTILLAMHSFTPEYKAQWRPWHVGLLFNRDDRFASAMQNVLQNEPGLIVGLNEPYSVADDTDYAIPVHGERRGLLNLELEIRQDLIDDETGQLEWAARLARILPLVLQRLDIRD